MLHTGSRNRKDTCLSVALRERNRFAPKMVQRGGGGGVGIAPLNANQADLHQKWCGRPPKTAAPRGGAGGTCGPLGRWLPVSPSRPRSG
jgi:hypothetical protein